LSQISFLGAGDKKSAHFGALASNTEFLGKFGRFSGHGRWRGDILDWHFSGRFDRSEQKSRFSGDISHYHVAATLFKIGSHERMGA
jgi:hypothetical protein